MSIRLQYLREAWSFLKTFTGRPGEVIVDTTNNRLVVHDGTTAGGYPTISYAANGAVPLPVAASAPASGGSLGQVLVNSTATAIVWHNGTAFARINNFAKVAAYTSFDNYIASATWTKVQFNTADSNDQGAFVAASNRFVAPEDGLYGLDAALAYKRNGSSNPTVLELQFYRNGAAAGRGRAAVTGTLVDGVTTVDLSSALKLAKADYVEVYVRFTGADGYVAGADSFFGAQQLA